MENCPQNPQTETKSSIGMSLSEKQKEALDKLYKYRENIESYLAEIDAILMVYFPEEYPLSYQHWMPQIKTALRDNTKWLSRGDYSMDYILSRIEDKMLEKKLNSGVTKYIK
jgi:hypothetical protein